MIINKVETPKMEKAQKEAPVNLGNQKSSLADKQESKEKIGKAKELLLASEEPTDKTFTEDLKEHGDGKIIPKDAVIILEHAGKAAGKVYGENVQKIKKAAKDVLNKGSATPKTDSGTVYPYAGDGLK